MLIMQFKNEQFTWRKKKKKEKQNKTKNTLKPTKQ